ncbi:Aliphatic amidase [Dirofilaria immitis]
MLLLTVLTFSFGCAFYHFETATSLSSSREEELEVKWNYYGKIRRFTVRSDKVSIYEELRKTLHLYEPAFQGILTWKDNENDSVLLNSSNELSLALKYKANKFLRLNTINNRFDDFQVTKEPIMLHKLHGKIFVGQLLDNEEIKIFDTNLSLEGNESQLSKQLARTQNICPVVIISNNKHEEEKTRKYGNQTDKKEMIERAKKIIERELSMTTPKIYIKSKLDFEK